jgi:acyl-CoA synthetase (AMP-forming)/AMP-acid ligase II
MASLATLPTQYEVRSAADDLAVFQYTSGTTRELPAAVRHPQRAIVALMVAALYGTGIRPGDRFFCPSSPAWGHGLWHGTLAPLALGVTTGTMAGKFDPVRMLRALQEYDVTNVAAAATHYRMLKSSGQAGAYRYGIRKLSFTGEPMDSATRAFVEATFGTRVCSMYGTTEVGVILADYPGAADYAVKPGALGKPVPGVRVEVQDAEGRPCPPDQIGEIKVWRRDAWFPTKDRGHVDSDGYFYHAGRADDVIISAGWTMSAIEIEDVLLRHPDVREAAVIGVADALRGQVVKAFIVSARGGDDAFARELQEFHAHAAQPARIPAARRVRGGAAQDARRQGQPQGASRIRDERRGAHACPVRRRRCFRRSPSRASMTCAAGSASRSRTRSSRGATRPRATTCATTRTGSATTTRSGAIPSTPPAHAGVAWSRRRAFSLPRAGSSRATSAGCPACTRCGPARTGRGTTRCGATTRSRPRHGSRS